MPTWLWSSGSSPVWKVQWMAPVAASRAYRVRSKLPMNTRPPATAGLACTTPPVLRFQRSAPVAASRA